LSCGWSCKNCEECFSANWRKLKKKRWLYNASFLFQKESSKSVLPLLDELHHFLEGNAPVGRSSFFQEDGLLFGREAIL
jgi:hypothetical protein